MNIVVLAKQVPDPEALIEIKRTGEGLEMEQKFTTSLFDEFALEEALRIKERLGGAVKVITLGTGRAVEVLRTGIAMGVDEVLLLEHQAFLDGDGYATALALSRAIAKGAWDIVLCGKQAVDDDRGEVGPMVAQLLGVPHVGSIVKLDIADGKAVAESLVDDGRVVVEVPLPAVLTAHKGLNEPRVPLVTGVMKAMRAQIPRATPEDLGLAANQIGLAGSRVRIKRYVAPKKRSQVQFIDGDAQAAAAEAVRILMDVERVI
ncbi:MAG TPA: electron transfer flavoprotein subunit beta/FixA family protein [Syntrophorhabdales bacterium]|nr:electron transfer flavoprotein subunit beta/FixA family protein [Syntrophorhabdales bacterium]